MKARFRLKTLFLATLLCGACLALAKHYGDLVEKRSATIEEIKRLNGRIYYVRRSEPGSDFPRYYLGPQRQASVGGILGGDRVSWKRPLGLRLYYHEQRLEEGHISRILMLWPDIEYLSVTNAELSEADFRMIGRLKSLQHLELMYCGVNDFAVEKLEGIPSLKYLHLHEPLSSTAASQLVKSMPALRSASLYRTIKNSAILNLLMAEFPGVQFKGKFKKEDLQRESGSVTRLDN